MIFSIGSVPMMAEKKESVTMAGLPERADMDQSPETLHLAWLIKLKEELNELGREAWNACKLFVILLLICGIAFPLVVFVIGQIFFPFQANGSLITNQNHQIVGSNFIGQSFTRPEYFHGRPSVTGYNASSSSGSNIGPTNPQLITGNGNEITVPAGKQVPAGATPVPGHPGTYMLPGTYAGVKTYAAQFIKENNLPPSTRLPADIVTASGSGLDPDISVDAALLQMNRIVQARHIHGGKNGTLTTMALRELIHKHTSERQLNFLGEPGVNVLELNLDLDRLYGAP